MTQQPSKRAPPSPTTLAAVFALLAALLVLSLAPPAEAYIYWANEDSIGRANLDGTGVDQSFVTGIGLGRVSDVAVDGAHLYWSESYTGQVGRANLDGTDVEPDFIDFPQACTARCAPPDLAVDAAHVYRTDVPCGAPWGPCTGAIDRANLDGSAIDDGFIRTANPVSGVAVDGAHLYWTNDYPPEGRIGRANLDGTAVDENFISGLPDASKLAVDPAHIYWSQNTYTFGAIGAIGRAVIDGTGVDGEFIPLGPNYRPDGIAVDASHVYWANGDSIGRANLDGTGVDRGLIDGIRSWAGIAVDALQPPGEATAKRTQRQIGKEIRVKLKVRAKERLTAKASGKIEVNPTYKLKPKSVGVAAGQTKTLKLKPTNAAAKKIAEVLEHSEKAKAKVKVKLTGQAGNSAIETLRVRLKR